MLIWRGGEIFPPKQILPLILITLLFKKKQNKTCKQQFFYSKLVDEGILSIKTIIKKSVDHRYL